MMQHSAASSSRSSAATETPARRPSRKRNGGGSAPSCRPAGSRGAGGRAGRVFGEERLAGRDHHQRATVYGGETTVTVRGSGVGGRNLEVALAAAIALDGTAGV